MEVLDPEKAYGVKALLPFLGKRVVDWRLEPERSPCVEGPCLIGLSEADARFDYRLHIVSVETTARR